LLSALWLGGPLQPYCGDEKLILIVFYSFSKSIYLYLSATRRKCHSGVW